MPGSQVKQSSILARVNGEPIYARDVLAGLPKDAFSTSASDAADLKLERLIEPYRNQAVSEIKARESERSRGGQSHRYAAQVSSEPGLPVLQV